MFRVLDEGSENEVQVEVTRSIRVGRTIRINPSEGYLGIDSGLIRVTQILRQEDIQSVDSPDHEHAEYVHQIEADKDVYLQGHEGNDYATALHELDTQPWIVYKYTNSQCVNDDEWYVLPLQLFVYHTMMY